MKKRIIICALTLSAFFGYADNKQNDLPSVTQEVNQNQTYNYLIMVSKSSYDSNGVGFKLRITSVTLNCSTEENAEIVRNALISAFSATNPGYEISAFANKLESC